VEFAIIPVSCLWSLPDCDTDAIFKLRLHTLYFKMLSLLSVPT